MTGNTETLAALLKRVRACEQCVPSLPLGPRPVLCAHSAASILIAGQAPGTRVHASGVAWDDPSGDRLRQWLGVDKDTFYDQRRFAILPMGFCYPGKGKSGDLPPRKECAPLWRPGLLERLPNIELTLLVGAYAQRWHLRERSAASLTATVRAFRDYLPEYFVMPHPSPRNQHWLKRNPWFGDELLPALQKRVAQLLQQPTRKRKA